MDNRQLFRGPKPPLLNILRKNCISVLGDAQLFGRFQAEPFHKKVANVLNVPALNLSFRGAGPEFFLQDWLLEPARKSRCIVLQVFSGRSVGCEDYPGMRMTARSGTEEPKRDRLEILNKIWFEDRAYCKTLVERWQKNYVRLMRELISKLEAPVVLAWMSERSPGDWTTSRIEKEPNFGAYPQLITRSMVEEIEKDAFDYIELAPNKGMNHGFTSRFTGLPCPVLSRTVA